MIEDYGVQDKTVIGLGADEVCLLDDVNADDAWPCRSKRFYTAVANRISIRRAIRRRRMSMQDMLHAGIVS